MPSPFAKELKITPTKRHHTESRCNIRKPRKGDNRGFQHQRFLQARAAETVPQTFTCTQPAFVAIPILQTPTIGTYTQPITAPVAVQPVATTSGQHQQPQKCCALCTSVVRQCLMNYQLPICPEWSNPEEEKVISRQQKEEEQEKEEEDWDNTRQNKVTKFQNETQNLCPLLKTEI